MGGQWIATTAISSGYNADTERRSFETGQWYKWYTQILALFANWIQSLHGLQHIECNHAYLDTQRSQNHTKRFSPMCTVAFGVMME